MNKKVVVGVLLLVLSFQALAIVPLIAGAIRLAPVIFKVASGQGTLAQSMLVTAPLAIGGIVTAIHVSRSDGTTTQNDDLYTSNVPRVPSSIEAAAGFTAGYPSLTPASSSTTSGYWQSSQGTCSTVINLTSFADLQNCLNTHSSADAPWVLYSGYSSDSASFVMGCRGNNTINCGLGYKRVSCPAGYNLSGSNCVLANAAAVARPVDNICPNVRNGQGAYVVDSTDPDCAGSQNPTYTLNGTVSTLHWVDNAGVEVDVVSNPDGSGRIVYRTPSADGANTITKTVALGPADAAHSPAITGSTEVTTAGTGSLSTSAPVAAPSLQLPTDYARTGEASTAAQTQIDADNARMGTAPAAEVIPQTTIPVSITSVLFASNTNCPAGVPLTFMGQSHVISYQPMCDLMIYLRPLFLALGAFSCAIIFIGGLKT